MRCCRWISCPVGYIMRIWDILDSYVCTTTAFSCSSFCLSSSPVSPCLFVPLLLWVLLFTCVQSPCLHTFRVISQCTEETTGYIFLLYFMRIRYCVRFWERGPMRMCACVRPYMHEDRSLILVPPLSHKLFYLMD